MTPKQIAYSDHAAIQRAARGIRRNDVRWLLATAPRIKADTIVGRDQRWEVRGFPGNRELRVIFIESATTLLLVTVEWADEETNT